MRALLLALLVLGAASVAVPPAAATHRTCDVTDAGCMAPCLVEALLRHPCNLRALDPCPPLCILP